MRELRPDGTLVLTAEDIDRAAQAHVEGRPAERPYFPRERHERTTFPSLDVSDEATASETVAAPLAARQESASTISNEPAAAADTAGDYLRAPVAAGQGQIVERGGAPREASDGEARDSAYLDAYFHANTQGRSDPAREAVSTHRPGEATAGAKLAAHPLTPNRTDSQSVNIIRRPAPLTSAGSA